MPIPGQAESRRAPLGDTYLSIVVPIWNGAAQLATSLAELAQFAHSRSYRTELILANDGSGPATTAVLERFATEHPEVVVLRHLPHHGKGAAISAGMQAARGRFRVFIDSDLAYPALEIEKLVRELEAGSDVAIACRVLAESRYVMSPSFFHYMYTRHVMSRVLNALVRAALLPGLRDTQAGLKGFTRDAAELIFPKLTIPGFGFDLECLYAARANNLKIAQVAVVFRYGDEPSTIRVLHDGLQFLADIVAVRWRGLLGDYTAEPTRSAAPVIAIATDAEAAP